jgi:hypothetical protein
VEWFLQEMESAIYSMVGTDGAMYALRRECFVPVSERYADRGRLRDRDGVICRAIAVVFEPRALGWEQGPTPV